MRLVLLPVVLATLLLGTTGCSFADAFGGDSSSGSETGSATGPVETIKGGGIEDGKHFGFIRSATPASGSMALIEFDEAEFLTGAEAAAAAAAAGEEAFDYFIQNDAEAFLTLPVAEGVTVTHVSCAGGCKEGIAGDYAAFAASFVGDPSAYTLDDPYRGSASQYWVTTKANLVTAIDEQYLP